MPWGLLPVGLPLGGLLVLATPAKARDLLADPDVTVLMVGNDSVTGRIARSDVRFRPVLGCGPAPCTVYLRR